MKAQHVLIIIGVAVVALFVVSVVLGARGGQGIDIAQLREWGESLFSQRLAPEEISVAGGSPASCIQGGGFTIAFNGVCRYEIAESSASGRRLTLALPEVAPFEIEVRLEQEKPEALTGVQRLPRSGRTELTLSIFETRATLEIRCRPVGNTGSLTGCRILLR